MKKGILLALPLVLLAPMMLLFLGIGSANIEAVRAACVTSVSSTTGGGSMRIGTLNWRGASHYRTNPHPGERPYGERVPNMVSAIDASGASVIGFQEFEPPQSKAFLAAATGRWSTVNGKGSRGEPSTANAIAYQPSAWKVDEVRYVTIRYVAKIQLPLVRFTSTSGLGSIWVLNAHNPAGVLGGTDASRDEAVRAEAAALTALQRTEPNTPLFLTGDMNDRARFKQLFTSLAPGWTAANPTDEQIDWIMGSPAAGFTGTIVERSTNDGAHAYTDHPFVHAGVTLPGAATSSAGATETVGLGVMPSGISASPGGPVSGSITIANANIKLKTGATPGIKALAAPGPDFITLNEVNDVPLSQMKAAAAGYDAFRENVADTQAMGNALMWRTDTWTRVDGGTVKIVEEDHTVFDGKNVSWSRYATWGVFKRADGASVSVVAAHQMTNPFKYPKQWGTQPQTRVEQYGLGMDHLVDLVGTLSAYGPVFLGGDMNTHPGDGANAAAPKMAAAGYDYTKDDGVIYNFYAAPVSVAKTWQISAAAVHSDHPALFTRMAMNGAGPNAGAATASAAAQAATAPASCPPCPTSIVAASFHSATTATNLATAKVAAAAAIQAGFRGEDLVTAVAIAAVESGWRPNAVNGTHYGLWQISAQHKGKVPGWNAAGDIYDPLLNARYAFALYSARPGAGEAKFADWIPFELTDYHQYLDTARAAVAAAGGGTTNVATSSGCTTDALQVGGVSGDRLNRLRQRAEMVIKFAQTYSSPCQVPGYDCQGVRFSGWADACTAISMMIYGNAYVGSGDGGERAYGSVVQGQQGSSWPPPPGAIVSWSYAGNGHVAIYLGGGDWVDNWGPVGHNAHDQVERGAKAHWLLPPPSFEGNFLNNGPGTSA